MSPDQYGRRGDPSYAGPNSWRKRTTIPGGAELKPPDPYRCFHHDRPDKFECPECIHWWEVDRG